jgi:hypothetical protein
MVRFAEAAIRYSTGFPNSRGSRRSASGQLRTYESTASPGEAAPGRTSRTGQFRPLKLLAQFSTKRPFR